MKSANWIIAVFVLSLTACGDQATTQSPPPSADNNYGYGFHYTYSNPNGLRLRQQDGESLLDYFSVAWSEMVTCSGLPAPNGPLILLVPYGDPAVSHSINGSSSLSGVFLDTNTILFSKAWPDSVKDTMLHILLRSAGIDDAGNMAHVYHHSYAHCL